MAACASTPKKTPAQLQQENKALVLGIEKSLLLKALTTTKGVYTYLHFIEINGESCSTWGREDCQAHSVELPPGQHTLDLECGGNYYGTTFGHTVPDYHITVEPGHIYQMHADASGDTCRIVHLDLTPGIAREIFKYALDPLYWKNGDTFRYFGGYMMTFMPYNESSDNWSKRITIQFVMSAQKTALDTVNDQQAYFNQFCPGAEFITMELGEDSFTYLFSKPACMNEAAHVGMERIYTGKEGIYKLAYQEKTPALSVETIQACLDFFDKSGIRTEEAPKE